MLGCRIYVSEKVQRYGDKSQIGFLDILNNMLDLKGQRIAAVCEDYGSEDSYGVSQFCLLKNKVEPTKKLPAKKPKKKLIDFDDDE